MLIARTLVALSLVASHVLAQRGGGGWDGSRAGWGEDQDYGDDGRPIQTIVTQMQTQTRTMVTTAISRTATTVVQATIDVKVSTVAAAPPPLSSISSSSTSTVHAVPVSQQVPLPSPPPSPLNTINSDSESIIPTSTDHALDAGSSKAQLADAGLTVGLVDSATTTKAIGAAQEVSAPLTVLTGTVPSLQSGSGSGLRTTGVPNFKDGANGVVYGHTTGSASRRNRGRESTLSIGLGILFGLAIAPN